MLDYGMSDFEPDWVDILAQQALLISSVIIFNLYSR